MKLIIEKNQINGTPEQFLRRAGYGFIRDTRRDKESYVRRMGNYHYPRLHMYVKQEGDKAIFDLHLDQKQTSYAGNHMHNAEYDGEVVESEIARLKELVGGGVPSNNEALSPWEKLRQNSTVDPAQNFFTDKKTKSTEEDKGWWQNLFQ